MKASTKTLTGPVVCFTALVAACATTAAHSDQLDEARTQVQALSQDPLAQQAAASDLQAALESLR